MKRVEPVEEDRGSLESAHREWADSIFTANASPLSVKRTASCWTGSVGDTPVCLLVEDGADADPEVAHRALSFVKRTGHAMLTLLIDGGSDTPEARSSLLRVAHRLSGVVTHVALEVGNRTDKGRLRAAAADFSAAVDSSAETSIPHFSSVEHAVEWARRLLRTLPANNTMPAPVRIAGNPRAPEAHMSPLDAITMIADEEPVQLGPTSAGIRIGVASIGGHTVGFAASTVFSGDGEIAPSDISATARLIEFCDAFHLPIVIALDTPGVAQGYGVEVLSPVVRAVADAATPLVVLVTRRAGGLIGELLTDGNLVTGEIIAWSSASCDAADRVIEPERTGLELLATFTRWANVDIRPPARRRAVPAR